METEVSSTPLPYATPLPRQGSPTVAATVLGFLGLGLIVLGGCFMIPVASPLINPEGFRSGMSNEAIAVSIILSLIACICFGFAAFFLFLSVRRLLAIMRG